MVNDAVVRLERELGASWDHLRTARETARTKRQQLEDALARLAPEDPSIVLFGSLARDEFTVGSDIDWTLLVDGLANPQHHDVVLEIEAELEALGIREPGREGTFGGLAFSHDIVHRIGGGDDTNRNTTQRILLLLESIPLGHGEAYERVVRQVLNRYVVEDWGWIHHIIVVPRFLQNDIARYWRTVAVDFAYKRRQRRGSGWALRTIKLRMSRKLTYAAGLLACFSSALSGRMDEVREDDSPTARTHPLVDHLARLVRCTPLEIVAAVVLPHQQLHGAARSVFDSYDRFIALLDDKEARDHLERLAPSEAEADLRYKEAREISHSFQDGLNGIFLEENGTGLFELTKKYGVF